LSLVSDRKTDEDGLPAGKLNGVPSQREQPNQLLEYAMESTILTDLILIKNTEEE
jgi:hypothetical protein